MDVKLNGSEGMAAAGDGGRRRRAAGGGDGRRRQRAMGDGQRRSLIIKNMLSIWQQFSNNMDC